MNIDWDIDCGCRSGIESIRLSGLGNDGGLILSAFSQCLESVARSDCEEVLCAASSMQRNTVSAGLSFKIFRDSESCTRSEQKQTKLAHE